MVAERIPEPFRHDTDHGDRCAAQFHRGAHDVVAPLERALPHVISQHDDARRSRLLVGVEEPTTNQGSHTRGAKCGGRECRRPDQHGRCVADNQIPELRAVRPEAVDRPHIAPPFEEVPSDTEFRLVRQGIVRLDDDDAIAVGQRDRGPQQFAPQVVPARADPDRNGERQPPGNGQTRILQQHPDTELVILQHVSSP